MYIMTSNYTLTALEIYVSLCYYWGPRIVVTLGCLVVYFFSAYHGHLTSLIDISHYKFNLPGGVGQKEHVHLAPSPDIYRGKYRDTEYSKENLGHIYANDVADICRKIRNKESGVCAYIAESMLSCGGQVIPPSGYLKEVYQHVRNAGGVCIADEVQVGFGRVGTHWWAFETQDVVPDIVTIGKPMGNGHPVAAVITTQEIAENFRKTGVEYFNTYGGNPVSCAIANAVFDVIEKEGLRQSALDVGQYLLKKCQTLKNQYEIVGDVRGVGLFVGIELVTDRQSRKPAKEVASYVTLRLREEYILMSTDGPDCNVLKLKPPMVFTRENVDTVINALHRIFNEVMENEITNKSSTRTRTDSCSKEARTIQSKNKETTIKSI